jgi:hypothetical protein
LGDIDVTHPHTSLAELLDLAIRFGHPLKRNEAYKQLRAALASPQEQAPVAEVLDFKGNGEPVVKWTGTRFLDHGTKLYTAPSSPGAAEADAARCEYCDDTGDVHDATGVWRGICTCPVGQAMSGEAKC